MDLASFKISIQKMTDDELVSLLADIRTSRQPVTDTLNAKERAKPKARSTGKASLASLKNSLTKEQLARLISKLSEES